VLELPLAALLALLVAALLPKIPVFAVLLLALSK